MDKEDIKKRIEIYLAGHFDGATILDGTDIFKLGLVDSLFAIQLVLFLESEFNIVIENDDVNLENFRTLETMSDLVKRKL